MYLKLESVTWYDPERGEVRFNFPSPYGFDEQAQRLTAKGSQDKIKLPALHNRVYGEGMLVIE